LSEQGKKKSLGERILNAVKKQVLKALVEQVKKKFRGIIKASVIGVIGYTIFILGVVFLWMSVTEYLSLFLPSWVSRGISGVALLIIGAILLEVSYSKLKF